MSPDFKWRKKHLDTSIKKLTSSVGDGLKNLAADISKVKTELKNNGFAETSTKAEDQDFITRDLDQNIKQFQTEKKLKVDGKLFPGGETESALFGQSLRHSAQAKKKAPKPQKKPKLVNDIFKRKSEDNVIETIHEEQDAQLNIQADATGRVIFEKEKSDLPSPTSEAIDKKELQKTLDFDPNKGGGDFRTLLMYGFEPDKIARNAEKEAQKIFPKQAGFEDDSDAFRHALGSYLMTKRYGADAAKKILDRHERAPGQNLSPTDTEMGMLQDLYNNRIGRDAALDPKNKDRNPLDVIKELHEQKKLQTRPFRLRKRK